MTYPMNVDLSPEFRPIFRQTIQLVLLRFDFRREIQHLLESFFDARLNDISGAHLGEIRSADTPCVAVSMLLQHTSTQERTQLGPLTPPV